MGGLCRLPKAEFDQGGKTKPPKTNNIKVNKTYHILPANCIKPPKTILGGLTMDVVHSSIADSGQWQQKNKKGQLAGHSAVALMYYIRFLDQDSDSHRGSGRADIDVVAAASALGKSRSTISRWIHHGYRLGLFRHKAIKLAPGIYRIYYRAITKICTRHGLEGLGACGRVGLEMLTKLKFLSTELEAQKLQGQSIHKEKTRNNVSKLKNLPTPEALTTSDLGAGAILCKRGRFTFLKNSAFPYGGSQTTIARRQGRHKSTVQRRLSATYRWNHDVEPIRKTQLLAAPRYHSQIMSDSEPKRLVKGQVLTPGPHRQLFRCCPNVYVLNHELVPLRYRRSELKRMRNEPGEHWGLTEDWKLNPEYSALKEQWKAAAPRPIKLTYLTKRHRRRRVGIKKTN
jgi:hypothetical protein